MEFTRIGKTEKQTGKDAFYRLYKEAVTDREVPYCAMEQEVFEQFFFEEDSHPELHKVSVVAAEGTAAASGCFVGKEERAYITLILVDKKHRRTGLGGKILSELEKILIKESGVQKIEAVFFNPMTLSWEVPGHLGCEHPNAPGVDVSGAGYLFLKNNGYRDYAMQNSYFLPLSKYDPPKSIEDRLKTLKENKINITIYDKKIHKGMEEMLERLANPMWIRDIPGEPSVEEGGRPILIAEKDSVVLGFTGPMACQENGRGYFAGIAVDEAARGMGVAKTLFSLLCVNLKELGASYMTLFTGENNQARNIYEEAGFKIVKTWADMRKTRKE